jgi:hypothetical protein
MVFNVIIAYQSSFSPVPDKGFGDIGYCSEPAAIFAAKTT